jgi:hypothetical protein
MLSEQLAAFAGPDFSCTPAAAREALPQDYSRQSRTGMMLLLDLGAGHRGRIMVPRSAFYQIVAAVSGHRGDSTELPLRDELSRIELLIMDHLCRLVAACLARAIPRALSTLDEHRYAPHPSIQFIGLEDDSSGGLGRSQPAVAYEVDMITRFSEARLTILMPELEDFLCHFEPEKYSSLRDRWEMRQHERRTENLLRVGKGLGRRLARLTVAEIMALLGCETDCVVAACLAYLPHIKLTQVMQSFEGKRLQSTFERMLRVRPARPALIAALSQILAKGERRHRNELRALRLKLRVEARWLRSWK